MDASPTGRSPHRVRFYEDDTEIADAVARHLAAGAVAGDALIAITTAEHGAAIEVAMSALGLDVARMKKSGQLHRLDAEATLSTFMVNGRPDGILFQQNVGALVQREHRDRGRVCAFGEMVDVLWQRGQRDAALQLEAMWNDLQTTVVLDLLCGYRITGFAHASDASPFSDVCGCHSDVSPFGPSFQQSADRRRDLAIATLQQKAHALESEMAARRILEERLLEADRKKNEFIAVLGHELRNPLSPILFAVQRMRGSKEHAREVEIIERQTRHILRLVEDVVDLSRVAAGKVTLVVEPVDVADIVSRAIETVTPQVAARQHELRVDAESCTLRADAARVAQVIINLVQNAAKYSDPKSRIDVRVSKDRDDVVISVRDNGRGIPADLMATMFDCFVQGRNASELAGGLGLGLTVAKNLVELHGGSISAHSEGPNRGAEMTVRLPVAGPALN